MKRRTTALPAALIAALALGACGESEEDKATAQVCDARADISRQLDSLRALTPSTISADQVITSVQAIGDDVRKIADAQSDLADDRRAEIQQANKTFGREIKEIGSTLLKTTSVADAKAQLQTAVDELETAYRDSLAKIDCD